MTPRSPSFLREQRGFTGAEKVLAATFALAVVALGSALLRRGADHAGQDARATLEQGFGSVGSFGGVDLTRAPRAALGGGPVAGAGPARPPGAGPEPPAPAQPPGVPPPVSLNVPLIQQQTNVWCWLATSEMVIRYRKGSSTPQCQMLEKALKLRDGYCCQAPGRCLRTGSLQEIQALLRMFGDRQSGLAGPLDPMTLHRLLSDDKPVIAALQLTPFSGHVVVLRGLRFQPYRDALGRPNLMPMVTINDPLSYLPTEVPYPQLLRFWRASIVVQ